MKVTRVNQTLIRKSHPVWKLIDTMCYHSKNLYNYANYIIREEFVVNKRYVSYFEMIEPSTTKVAGFLFHRPRNLLSPQVLISVVPTIYV